MGVLVASANIISSSTSWCFSIHISGEEYGGVGLTSQLEAKSLAHMSCHVDSRGALRMRLRGVIDAAVTRQRNEI